MVRAEGMVCLCFYCPYLPGMASKSLSLLPWVEGGGDFLMPFLLYPELVIHQVQSPGILEDKFLEICGTSCLCDPYRQNLELDGNWEPINLKDI